MEALILSNSKRTIGQLTFAVDGLKDNKVCYLDTDSFKVEKNQSVLEQKSLVTKEMFRAKNEQW